jgi:hypothetical protein
MRDTITHYVNMEVPAGESFWPNGIFVDLRDYDRSLNRLRDRRDRGAVILPGREPLVLSS